MFSIRFAKAITSSNTMPFNRSASVSGTRWLWSLCVLALQFAIGPGLLVHAGESNSEQTYVDEIQPLLAEYCYDCHGYGESEGNFALDQFDTAEQASSSPDLWWRVIKNLRAGVMPPEGAAKLSQDEQDAIERWVKFGPFGIDPDNIDPGPVTVRRLNRQEYGNTVRELMGVSFEEKILFPPDDSGHGFDNVADALMVSPLLLDKYLQAAEMIVDRAVPKVTKIVPRQDFVGADFVAADVVAANFEGGELTATDSGVSAKSLDGKQAAEVARKVVVDSDGEYLVDIKIQQHGSFEFDPARYVVTCRIDGAERFELELGWDANKRTEFDFLESWSAGEHAIEFEIQPVAAKISGDGVDGEMLDEDDDTHVRLEVESVSIEGPRGTDQRVHPQNYERFFTRDEPPVAPKERRRYAAETLRAFATKAYRRNVPRVTVNRLTDIAESVYSQPGETFETGIARAIVAVLTSPRFLFRIESAEVVDADAPHAPVDEYSLASRLSYFLWSSMPDEELFRLAEEGELRSELSQQVDRMLSDPKADAFVQNFVGQWLRTRDVIQVSVDPAVVLGLAEELNELRAWFRSQFRRGGRRDREQMSEEEQAKIDRYREIRGIVDRVDDDLKRSMQQETEKFVEYVWRNDLSMLDLLDSDYTFLNEKLAEHYGIPGVEGSQMRRVELTSDSPRGGVLTQASMLLVTSNPTRTSPVKRGLFILDNILGTPAPPAPAAVPELEASADRFSDHTPTLRELLSVHRESDLCASCHARMDPLGLALENFNALGMWRDTDHGVPIETEGELVTGESFQDVTSLKQLLREHHAEDFYRCVTEKMLIFAIGRGIEYSDEHTVDLIVARMKTSGGKFSALVQAVVESAPFQRQRIKSASRPTNVDHSRQ